MSEVNGFFAYPSYPLDLNETIENFIKITNESKIMEIKSWKDMSVNGNFIIDKILEEIDKADVFLCDLTYLNFNVLFELGYAIAKDKKIWISLNTDILNSKKNYERLRILTTIGYSTYTNSQVMFSKLCRDEPYAKLADTVLKDITYKSQATHNIFFLKSPVDSEASTKVTVGIKESNIKSIQDDPQEASLQPLAWYLQNIDSAVGVIAHFASEDHTDVEILNAKNSLMSGIARGFDKPLLILAHTPFRSPIDYRDSLKLHATAKQCSEYFKEWVEPIKKDIEDRKIKYSSHLKDKRALVELQNLFIGEPIAEHESEELVNYFLETRQYVEALNSQHTLFVGRKGTGKTANFYKIADEISSDKRNFVCIIQPVGHEIDGVLNMLQKSLPNSEKGYLIESIWKYLIYTELAKSVNKFLKNRPAHLLFNEEEENFMEFVNSHKKMIDADFTLRLENTVKELCEIPEGESIDKNRMRISEILHEHMIGQLRIKLGNVLSSKNKVCILIDNLDASWTNRQDLPELCMLLFGLLNVIKEVTEDFAKADYRQKRVNVSLIVFLRSDIFNLILSYANERDKISHSKLIWEDAEQLFRIIENRFEYSAEGITSPEDLWDSFFCKEIDSKEMKKYISDLILPRPRDIIYLFRGAIQEAVNRGHIMVEESDFKTAEFSYSQYALESLLPENGNRLAGLESLLYNFAGSNSIIDEEEIEDLISDSIESDMETVIDVLCDLTFLGLETKPNEFEFINERRSKEILKRLSKNVWKNSGRTSKRFKIHRAFHSYLDIGE